jgi:hypothetical protein
MKFFPVSKNISSLNQTISVESEAISAKELCKKTPHKKQDVFTKCLFVKKKKKD